MDRQERRNHRRLPLHLSVAPVLETEGPGGDEWLTRDISSGGMYVQAPQADAPEVEATLEFVMSVPPGAGYYSSEGKIRGSGQVLRRDELAGGAAGLAVRFTERLALEF